MVWMVWNGGAGALWDGMVWGESAGAHYGMKWNWVPEHTLAWNGMGCRSTLWYGMVWYGMGCRSTQCIGMIWGAGAHNGLVCYGVPEHTMVRGAGAHNGSGCRSTQWFGMDGAGAQVDRVYHSAGTVAHELLD